MTAGTAAALTTESDAWAVAAQTPDPELPMVTIADLGVLRAVEATGQGVVATITPTYSGCPAMREIGADVVHRLRAAGYANASVRTQLSPAWTSDWISDIGRAKLAHAGIAPPQAAPAPRSGPVPLDLRPRRRNVACPHCGSSLTVQTAAFSATACKALYRCTACVEPFEYVKEI